MVTFEGRVWVLTGRGLLWYWGSAPPPEYRVPGYVNSVKIHHTHSWVMLSVTYIWIRSSQVFLKKRRNEMERKRSRLWVGKVEGEGNSKEETAGKSLVIPTPGRAASLTRTPRAAHKPLPLLIKSAGMLLHPYSHLADTHPAWAPPPPKASSDTHHFPTNTPSSPGLSVPSLCSHTFLCGMWSLRPWTMTNS